MGELLFAAFLVLVGFVMVVVGQELIQFFGIIVIMLGIGAGVMANLRQAAASSKS